MEYRIEADSSLGMKVPVTIYADDTLIEKMMTDRTIKQAINVATLPGIEQHSVVLPDGHEGYGFHVGGVAAMDAEEARNMLDASRRHPKLICQVVPSPLTFKIDDTINDVLASGYLGSIISIELRATQSNFPDFRGDMHWRNDRSVSGYNILNMGIWYESLMRWVGPASSVYASGSVTVNRCYDNDGTMRPVTIPDHVEIICDMAIGAKAHFTFSAVTGMDNKNGLWIFGSNGTLYVDTRSMSIYCANRDSTELDRVDIPRNKQSYWRVEEGGSSGDWES